MPKGDKNIARVHLGFFDLVHEIQRIFCSIVSYLICLQICRKRFSCFGTRVSLSMRDSFDTARYFLNLSKSSFSFMAVCSKNLKRCGLYGRLRVRPRGNMQRTRALRRKEVNLSTKVIRYEMIEHQTRYASISRKQDQTASIGRLFFNRF